MKKMISRISVAALVIASLFLVGCAGGGDNPQPLLPGTQTYVITWNDENGDLITTTTVAEGVVPAYNYAVQDTEEWDYTFRGWSETPNGEVLASIPAATVAATYYAIVDRVKQQYTVTFESNLGSEVVPITVDYNETVNAPSDPSRDEHSFVCWCSDEELETPVEWPITVTKNTKLFASWNEKINIGDYLSALLSGYALNPYSYIPEPMRPAYSANLVDASAAAIDYSNFVPTSQIKGNGFGEQWHMITDNLQQSMTFFNALSVVEGLATTSVTTFNDWLDTNPSDTATHSFKSGIYNVTINYDGLTIEYILDYTAEFPIVGEQTAQIKLSMDIATAVKKVRIQLGNPNVVEYELAENSYTFAIKYLGVRKASFSIARNEDGSVEGYINERLGVDDAAIDSAADFYITDEYVSAVGNKASGIIGFENYICELYDVTTGKLLSYEVREKTPKFPLATFNTLWFDLSYIDGIDSIKYRAATENDEEAFFVNGSATEWATKNVGGFGGKMLSRRFDIEFRTQYFYSYDTQEGTYVEVQVQVPMLFVQEENYATLVADVKEVNPGVNIDVTLPTDDLDKVKSDYATLVDLFIDNEHELIEVA